MIESHADSLGRSRGGQNLHIISPVQANFADVHRVPTPFAEDRCSPGCKSLIQENALHATRSILIISSSTAAAA